MLGFGELVANEVAFRFGWGGTKVFINSSMYMSVELTPPQIFPTHRNSSSSSSRRVGPGVEMRADPVERRRRSGQEMDMYTSLE